MVAANTAWLGQLQLPAHLSLSAGVLSEAIPALTASEQASIAPMAPARLAEFAQGRMHARIALARFGLADASIPMGSKRAPLWPAGFVGSISHVPSDAATDQPGRVIAVVSGPAASLCVLHIGQVFRYVHMHHGLQLATQCCSFA